MGLSKSKQKPRKGEEQKGRIYSVFKAKERRMDRPSQESEKIQDTRPAESAHGRKGAAKGCWPSSEVEEGREKTDVEGQGQRARVKMQFQKEEKPEVKVNSSKKKVVIPQIVITRASKETLTSDSSVGSKEQRTIREQVECGPYCRHRNPSTVAAYESRE